MASSEGGLKRARMAVDPQVSRQAFINKYLPFVEVVARVLGSRAQPFHFRLNQPDAADKVSMLSLEMNEARYLSPMPLPTVTGTFRLILSELDLNEITMEKRLNEAGFELRVLRPVWLPTTFEPLFVNVQQVKTLKKQAEDMIGEVFDRRLMATEALQDTFPSAVMEHVLTPYVSYSRTARRRQSRDRTYL